MVLDPSATVKAPSEGECVSTNVLVVLTDQFRADCLGVAGNPDVATPTLDGLAADGVYYPNSFCVAPLCTPSRYTLLTGQQPAQHGVHGNNRRLRRELPTLPELARGGGVGTAAVGKMHFTPAYMDTGFDTMALAEQNGDGRLVDDYHRQLTGAGLVDGNDLIDQLADFRRRANASYWSSYGAATSDVPERWHSTTWIADQAMNLIDDAWTAGGQLMYLSFVKPHHPFDPPAPWDTTYAPDELTILPGWTDRVPPGDPERGYFDNASLDEAALRRVMAMYYGTISHIDHHLGRVLQRLRELDAYENTLVVFTADHGEYLGFHHMVLKSGPMYDPLVRVPLIVKPTADTAGAHPGTRDERLTCGADIVPTALAGLGLPVPPDLRGHDLTDRQWSRATVTAQSGVDGYMVRSDRAKLLADNDRTVFFDLESDPLELSPVPPDRDSDWQRELASELDRIRADQSGSGDGVPRGTTPGSPSAPEPAAMNARFEELLRADHPWLSAGPGSAPPAPCDSDGGGTNAG